MVLPDELVVELTSHIEQALDSSPLLGVKAHGSSVLRPANIRQPYHQRETMRRLARARRNVSPRTQGVQLRARFYRRQPTEMPAVLTI